MSSHDDLPDTCEFGHIFEVHDKDETGEAPGHEIREEIEEGDIEDLDDIRDETGTDVLKGIMGNHYKKVKLSAGSQGTPYTFILGAADRFDTDLDYTVKKVSEKMFVTPESHLHGEFMQRKQQAEQNIKNTMQNLTQLRKQKHMLEHDIRKLRSRAEAISEGEETQIKGDFIELVDGAGAAGQQGGDEASLKFYRDQNIYPSIVADFNEMSSLDDLKEGGKLGNLPENEKAILKKKYTMYEKWKDLYGSEIQRKLNELKGQMQSIERSIEETEEWLEPYVRDMVMINQKNQDELAEDINRYMTFKGYSTQYKEMEFIAYKPLLNKHGSLEAIDNEENASHYKVVYLFCVHVNIAGGGNPNSPQEGPTVGVVFWHPAIMCKHVFKNIFKQKIKKQQKEFKNLVADYQGELDSEADGFKEKREEAGLSVRKLREEVGEKLREKDEISGDPPIELSATVRRIEDGFESTDKIVEEYGEEYLKAIDEILDTNYSEKEEEKGGITDFQKKMKKLTGRYDIYHLPDPKEPLGDLKHQLKYDYYYDYKLELGLYTMK